MSWDVFSLCWSQSLFSLAIPYLLRHVSYSMLLGGLAHFLMEHILTNPFSVSTHPLNPLYLSQHLFCLAIPYLSEALSCVLLNVGGVWLHILMEHSLTNSFCVSTNPLNHLFQPQMFSEACTPPLPKTPPFCRKIKSAICGKTTSVCMVVVFPPSAPWTLC